MSKPDIVERLRHMEREIGDDYGSEVAHRAASEIDRLRKQLADRDAQWERATRERLRAWNAAEIGNGGYGIEIDYTIAAIRERLEQDR